VSDVAAAQEPPITLSKWLEQLIERLSDPAVRGTHPKWRLRMCVHDNDQSWAEVLDGDKVVMTFAHKPRDDGLMHRVVEIPFSVLLTCGELYQDSKDKLEQRGDPGL
jgi:hypothetical protein